jgi:predicted SnoaL-like aldol condensation-catalyzing enzyme
LTQVNLKFTTHLCCLQTQQMKNTLIVQEFIDQVWNTANITKADAYLHPDFIDYSLPPALTADKEGMKKWIAATGASFKHTTTIEEQASEGDKVFIKIRMHLKHIGIWRNIEPTGIEIETSGFRLYKIVQGKIIAHWGLIDGQSIENQLNNAAHGCKIAP